MQARFIKYQVEGVGAGHARRALATASVMDHEALRLAAFKNLVATVDDGTDLILNKVQGVGRGRRAHQFRVASDTATGIPPTSLNGSENPDENGQDVPFVEHLVDLPIHLRVRNVKSMTAEILHGIQVRPRLQILHLE